MGDRNQLLYVQSLFAGFSGKVLEVGSKDYGNTQPFREIFSGEEYVGLDLEDGPNVDVVVNLEDGIGPLQGKHFDLVLICSVLEHSPRPWIVAHNIQELMAEDGVIVSIHPWVWRYHKYPDDYFRFSPRGIQTLFFEMQYWLPMLYSTYVLGEFVSFTGDEHIDNKMAVYKGERKYLPYLQSFCTGTKSRSRYEALLHAFSKGPKKD